MERNDSLIYKIGAASGIVVTVVVLIITLVSMLHTEPKIKSLLNKTENIDKNYAQAYVLLRKPMVFAGYDKFDSKAGQFVKNALTTFDQKVVESTPFVEDDIHGLLALLRRREMGSQLGLKTVVYSTLVSLIFLGALFYEKRKTETA